LDNFTSNFKHSKKNREEWVQQALLLYILQESRTPQSDHHRSIANVESYNGSTWTEITDVNTARRNVKVLQEFKQLPYFLVELLVLQQLTELWNGTSWTEVNDLNTGRVI
jgi:hypothetical protein